jgi:Ca-activated chloride channel family protein
LPVVIAMVATAWAFEPAGIPAQPVEKPKSEARGDSRSVFRSQTQLVVLQASVVDAERRFVKDLRLEDFAVYEEGVRQPLSLFAAGSAPLDLVLLLDGSSSMLGVMKVVQTAAINFLRTLRPEDRAALVVFNDKIQEFCAMTSDTAQIESAIRRASPVGDTAVNEALYVALWELVRGQRTGGEQRRQALVVLSDGDDNSSRVGFDSVLDRIRRSPVTVFSIVPKQDDALWWQQPYGLTQTATRRKRGLFNLRQLADETGGRVFLPARIEDLAGVYDEVSEELSQQYWLAYSPVPSVERGFRRISVRVETRPGLQVRTRSGYFPSGKNTAAAILPGAPDTP